MRPRRPDPRRIAGAVALLAATTLGAAAAADDRATCGTVVVPAGIGLSTPAPANTLDPALYGGALYERELMQLMFRPLVQANGALQIDWEQGLAASIDVSADDTVYTVTLKPYDWSDGTPVTAADVLFDWNQIKALGPAYTLYGTGGIPQLVRDVAVLDPHRIRFTLTHRATPEWFELAGLGQIYALPSADWGRYTLAEQQSLQSQASFYRLSDGPFLLDEFHLGRFAAFVPNPRYGGHRATIRRFVVDFLEGADPLEALRSGAVDMADLPFQVWRARNDFPGYQQIPIGPANLLYTIIPNLRSRSAAFLADVSVRQAISTAIDQTRLIDIVYHGQGLIDRGFVPTSLQDDVAPSLRSGRSALDYDPARAGALLDAAGWKPGPDGIRTRNGQAMRFSVFVTAGLEERLLALQLIQRDLRAVGIAIDIKEMEFNQLIAKMLGPSDGWQSVYMGWTMESYPDGTQWFSATSSGNYAHYADPHMDAMLEAAITAPDKTPLFDLERYVLEQQPMIFLPAGYYTVLARPGIGGIDRMIGTNGNLDPEYLTLSKELSCDDRQARPPS